MDIETNNNLKIIYKKPTRYDDISNCSNLNDEINSQNSINNIDINTLKLQIENDINNINQIKDDEIIDKFKEHIQNNYEKEKNINNLLINYIDKYKLTEKQKYILFDKLNERNNNHISNNNIYDINYKENFSSESNIFQNDNNLLIIGIISIIIMIILLLFIKK